MHYLHREPKRHPAHFMNGNVAFKDGVNIGELQKLMEEAWKRNHPEAQKETQ